VSPMLRLLDRFFANNPILLAAFIGVHPDALRQTDTDTAGGAR